MLLGLVTSAAAAWLLSLLLYSWAWWVGCLVPGVLALALLQSSLQLEVRVTSTSPGQESVLCQVGDKAVLVTGCDTGFGLALAKHLRGDNSVNNVNINVDMVYSEVWASRCLLGVCLLTRRARAPRSCGSSPAPSCTWFSWT